MKLAVNPNLETPIRAFLKLRFCQTTKQWVVTKPEDESFYGALRIKAGLHADEPDSTDACIRLLEAAGKRNFGINFIEEESCNTTN